MGHFFSCWGPGIKFVLFFVFFFFSLCRERERERERERVLAGKEGLGCAISNIPFWREEEEDDEEEEEESEFCRRSAVKKQPAIASFAGSSFLPFWRNAVSLFVC